MFRTAVVCGEIRRENTGFKLSGEPLEGKGGLKKPTDVHGIAGSSTEMSWWLVLAQVLSPWDFPTLLGWVTVMWHVPCSSPILCVSLGPPRKK